MYLRSIRSAYLSTAPPPRRQIRQLEQKHAYLSPSDRQSIDSESQATLRDINASISSLASAEALRHGSAVALAQKRRQKGLGVLGAWAAGGASQKPKNEQEAAEDGREEGLSQCREGVIWFLRSKLEGVGNTQRTMMEMRLEREKERSRDLLSMTDAGSMGLRMRSTEPGASYSTGGTSVPAIDFSEPDRQRPTVEPSLSPEQLQMFEEENRAMLRLYEDRLDQVR